MNGPSGLVAQGDTSNADESDAITRLSLLILAAYLALTALPLFRWSLSAESWLPFGMHLTALALVVSLVRTQRVARGVREWTPLALGPFLYIELRWIIAGAAFPHADALVSSWEANLFGDPSRTLALQWHSRPLSELLHLCYVSYYALVYVPPSLLWLRRRHRAFASTILALVVTYASCFVIYMLFPVDGPRYLRGPAAAPDGPIHSMVVALLESGSSRGTAFPSSHVAASVVAAICALRFQRRVGVVAAVLAVGLAIGAVYGGYHYAIDIFVGAITGLVAVAVAYVVEDRRLRRD